MNGAMHTLPNVLDIRLKRGPSGLGFNIVGGTDQQYMHNDSSIYVSRIKENGAAALDGRLREGDKILEINGNKLENLGHHQAVELFRTAGEDVELRVQQRPPTQNGPVGTGSDSEPSVPLALIGIVAVAAITFAFIYIRYHSQSRRHF